MLLALNVSNISPTLEVLTLSTVKIKIISFYFILNILNIKWHFYKNI